MVLLTPFIVLAAVGLVLSLIAHGSRSSDCLNLWVTQLGCSMLAYSLFGYPRFSYQCDWLETSNRKTSGRRRFVAVRIGCDG